eukprot:6195243-Pleurochrysis_carterae.AAC.3
MYDSTLSLRLGERGTKDRRDLHTTAEAFMRKPSRSPLHAVDGVAILSQLFKCTSRVHCPRTCDPPFHTG